MQNMCFILVNLTILTDIHGWHQNAKTVERLNKRTQTQETRLRIIRQIRQKAY